jgi:hypothetical protein
LSLLLRKSILKLLLKNYIWLGELIEKRRLLFSERRVKKSRLVIQAGDKCKWEWHNRNEQEKE